MENKTQQIENIDDEIDLSDIIKVLWNWRKLIIYGTIFISILTYIIVSFLVPKVYLGNAFFQLSKNGFRVSIPAYKQYSSIFADEVAFYNFIKDNYELINNELDYFKKVLRDHEYLDNIIKGVEAYSDKELENLRASGETNYIVGLELTLEGSDPQIIEKVLTLLGDYIRNSLMYRILSDYINDQLKDAITAMNKFENNLINAKFNLKELIRKKEIIYQINEKYPNAAEIETRQLVSIEEGGYRYLSPVTQLIGIESSIADIKQSISNYERNYEINRLKVEYFNKVKKVISSQKNAEKVLVSLLSLRDSMFKEDPEVNDIEKLVLNGLNNDFERFSSIYYEILTFIDKPDIPHVPIKPKRKTILAVTFFMSFFILVFLSFIIEWWRNNKNKIIETR
ncbi:MAG: Wzz/FepE/Etk N-terminal domain-containing protein [Promethearchaeota archaeon]